MIIICVYEEFSRGQSQMWSDEPNFVKGAGEWQPHPDFVYRDGDGFIRLDF